MQPKLKPWESVEQWEDFVRYCDEIDRKRIAAYKQQMANQRPKMHINGWQLLCFFLGACFWAAVIWVGWQVITAIPKFIEAWQ